MTVWPRIRKFPSLLVSVGIVFLETIAPPPFHALHLHFVHSSTSPPLDAENHISKQPLSRTISIFSQAEGEHQTPSTKISSSKNCNSATPNRSTTHIPATFASTSVFESANPGPSQRHVSPTRSHSAQPMPSHHSTQGATPKTTSTHQPYPGYCFNLRNPAITTGTSPPGLGLLSHVGTRIPATHITTIPHQSSNSTDQTCHHNTG